MRRSFLPLSSFAVIVVVICSGAQAQQGSAKSGTPSSSGASAPAAGATGAGSSNLALPTEKDKVSYAIGVNIGSILHRQAIQVDPNIVARGLNDALTGSKPLLTDDQVRVILAQVQQQMRTTELQHLQAEAAKNKSEGESFLAANRTKPGVVTLPSGLQYKVLKQGSGPKPAADDLAVCNYRGMFINGMEFDNSYKRGQPVTVPVNRVIKGWGEALQLMPVGSKYEIFIPPSLAYGEQGGSGDIGPNMTLVFDLELIAIKKPAPAPAAQGQGTGQSQPQTPPPSPRKP